MLRMSERKQLGSLRKYIGKYEILIINQCTRPPIRCALPTCVLPPVICDVRLYIIWNDAQYVIACFIEMVIMLNQISRVVRTQPSTTMLLKDSLAGHLIVRRAKGIPYLNHALGIMRARLLFTVMSAMKNYYIIQYYYRKTFNFSKS